MGYDLLMVDPAGRTDDGWYSMASENMIYVRQAMADLGMVVGSSGDAVEDVESPLGIPTAKLSVQGGWTVTPSEISVALLALSVASPAAMRSARLLYERWDDWVAFLGDACEHGGFRVE
ncbi:hypothetical protein [Embleya sp. NBC_00896]|uniref:hypothetical protein n=1 Tax=Embleya sp. NBC_00896 TaxID=2975961 RepID=UPI002F90CEB4|nr:hypothetical protein OG928_48675 [Embleya sp. NBC_00896]